MRLDRLATLGMFHPLARLRRGGRDARDAILMYHSVSDTIDAARHPYFQTTTTPLQFETQLRVLREGPRRVVPLAEVALGQSDASRVAITFDDGYADFASEAFPRLAARALPSTVFLATDYVGDVARTFNGRSCLTWPQVRELHAKGVEFGSHTASHPQLHEVSPARVRQEVQRSKAVIEDQLGAAVAAFSYPYAFPEADPSFCERLCDILRECGYRYGVSTIIGRVDASSERYALPRVPVNLGDDAAFLEAKIAGGYDWLHPVQLALKRAKVMRRRGRAVPQASLPR